MTNSDKRRALLCVAGGLMGLGSAAGLYGLAQGVVRSSRAFGAVRRENEENGVSEKQLRAEGVLPGNSVILHDRDRIADALGENVRATVGNPVARSLELMAVPGLADAAVSGNTAFYIRNSGGRPMFAFPRGKLGRRLVMHEVGHYLADRKRRDWKEYQREYRRGAGSESSPLAILDPERRRDLRGRMTRYGMEDEAWDLSGVPADDPLRRAALSSYRGSALRRALLFNGMLASLAGLGVGLYALKKYPAWRTLGGLR